MNDRSILQIYIDIGEGFGQDSDASSVVQFIDNIIQNAIRVLKDFILLVTKYLDAIIPKNGSPVLIVSQGTASALLPAIQLDSRFFLKTIEIKNEFLDRVLPA
jgi:hypothetical protein